MVFTLRNRVSQKLFPATVAILAVLAATAGKAAAVPAEVTFDDGGTSSGILFTWDGTPGGSSNEVVLPIINFTSNAETIPGSFSQDCLSCSLTFTTGPINFNSGAGTWSFGAGGSLSIDIAAGGSLDLTLAGGADLGEPGDSVNLLDGTFAAGEFIFLPGAQFFVASGIDTKHPEIVDTFFGGFNEFSFAQTTIAGQFTVTDPLTGAFEFAVSQVDVTNQQVPEPAGTTALLLLGLSGLAAARIGRRR